MNKYGSQEDRVIVVTSSEVWTFEQQSNKYEDQRQIPIEKIEAITVSED